MVGPTVAVDSPTIALRVERDCVHASDDGDSRGLTLASGMTLADLLQHLRASRYLPEIHGGEATWLVMSSARGERPIGVCAQQWSMAKLLVPDETLRSHFRGAAATIEFRYRRQQHPEALFREFAAP